MKCLIVDSQREGSDVMDEPRRAEVVHHIRAAAAFVIKNSPLKWPLRCTSTSMRDAVLLAASATSLDNRNSNDSQAVIG